MHLLEFLIQALKQFFYIIKTSGLDSCSLKPSVSTSSFRECEPSLIEGVGSALSILCFTFLKRFRSLWSILGKSLDLGLYL